MNEVLIIKQGPSQVMFYYTRDALRDVQLQLVSYLRLHNLGVLCASMGMPDSATAAILST